MTSTDIRPARAEDAVRIREIAAGTEMFRPDELDWFGAMIATQLAEPGKAIWRVAGPGPDGAAYAEPEPMAEGIWNMRFIGVAPAARRTGLARALIGEIEAAVREAGARMLIIETSSQPAFASARALYLALAYEEEARLRDWYGPNDAKVVFRKLV